MILIPYFTEATIDPTTPGKVLALVHPGGTQTGSLFFRGFDLLGFQGGPVRLRIARHPSKATGGTTSNAYSFLDNAPTSFAEVRWGSVSWPADTQTFLATAFAETRSSGGGIVSLTQNAAAGALTIGPDHSLVVETVDPDTRGEFTLRILWGEQRSSLPHIASATLPAASAYTAATHFNVPVGWTSIAFAVTYTAHASSSGGKPAWRGSCSDGTNDYPMTITDMIIDVLGQRLAYPMGDRWYTTVAAGETIRFNVSFDIPPGMPKVRLDLAEIGDITNRGTASVVVTGQ